MKPDVVSRYHARMQRVLSYIDEHLDDDLDVDLLSGVAAFSKYHFHRQFTSLFGISIHRYVQLLRLQRASYRLAFDIDPNRAALPNSFAVRITRGGKPVAHAGVVARFAMLDMTMSQLSYRLPEKAPGTFSRSAPALVMVGHWALTFEVTPPGSSPFDVTLVDHAAG